MIIFVICNYMREILNISMLNVYVNYKILFIERQCYIFMTLAQGSCAASLAGRPFEWQDYVVNVNKHGCQGERQCQ